MRRTAAHSSSLRTHPDGNDGLPKKIACVRSETAASSASRSQRQPCREGCSGTSRGTSSASRTRWSIPAYVGSGTITSSPGSVSASSASSMLSPSPEVITTSPSGSYCGPPRGRRPHRRQRDLPHRDGCPGRRRDLRGAGPIGRPSLQSTAQPRARAPTPRASATLPGSAVCAGMRRSSTPANAPLLHGRGRRAARIPLTKSAAFTRLDSRPRDPAATADRNSLVLSGPEQAAPQDRLGCGDRRRHNGRESWSAVSRRECGGAPV
jgi:hypothetical protein